jgi:hypothetical protein
MRQIRNIVSEEQSTKGAARGPGSFCIPHAALDALIEAKASAYEICAYLVLARFTDETGCYSPASISAINGYTGANKTKGGPVDRALQRLKTIHAKRKTLVSNGRSGKSHAMIECAEDLGPILFDRATWDSKNEAPLPDGPTERGKILHVLPDFGEPLDERVWFGGNLVTGIGGMDRPLKHLKNAGEVAASLLLLLYAANDMETWGGVRPIGAARGPWKHYVPVDRDIDLNAGARLIRAKDSGHVAPSHQMTTVAGQDNERYWQALNALESVGLIYEVVLVLNRNAKKSRFANQEEFSDIAEDAEPYYELDCRTRHGYKPLGEEGIAGATARTAGDRGYSVATEGGHFDGTYAAIVPRGYGAMVAGIYRLRFRVSNPKNAGVRNAWARIYQNNREALEFVNRVRSAYKLPALAAPWPQAKAADTATAPAD